MLPCTSCSAWLRPQTPLTSQYHSWPSHLERAVERGGDIIGVDLLVVAARAVLDDAAADEVVIGHLAVRRAVEVDAGRSSPNGLNGLLASIEIRVEQIAVAGVGADEQRQRRRLVGRIAAVVERVQR